MALSTARIAAAALVLMLYAALCAAVWWRQRRLVLAAAEQARRLRPARAGVDSIVVAYASQTGSAEQLAWQTANLLHAAGEPVRVLPLGQLAARELAATRRALFLVSTYGEGDAPDNAAAFVRQVLAQAPERLAPLRYAVLALGDRTYANFCGFGRRLDAWLRDGAAQPFFERVEVSELDGDALQQWWQRLGHVAAIDAPTAAPASAWEDWTLAARRCLNPGSAGEPMFHLEFEPPAGVARPDWASGDLVQLQPPAEPRRPRQYSIASIAADGRIHLLVRRERRSDGQWGVASGWLTGSLEPGQPARLRIQPHPNFRLNGNAKRPLILIGNGSGLAGLRSHLRARAAAGVPTRNWLVFGERNARVDSYYADEIDGWQQGGVLERVDRVFSRDQDERLYVQHRLAQEAPALRAWVEAGAAIYVCGSLKGMAEGVQEALEAALGRDTLDALTAAGRLRRDVY